MSNYKYVLNAITGKLDKVADSALFKLKGIVDTTADLPLTGNAENDCYIVKANDRLYTWNSSSSTGLITNWVDVGSVSSVDWSVITNKPSSSVANIDSAVSLKHTQGTDQALDTGGANEITAVNAKAAYTHSGVTSGNPHSVSKSDVALGNVDNKSEATIISDVKLDSDVASAISLKHDGGTQDTAIGLNTTHRGVTTGNPHSVSKSDVGLGNVDNKSEATIITDVKADSDVADAISKKHTQGSDTTLGSMTANIDMNSHKLTGLSVPSSNGDSIRATTKITEANLEAAIDYKLSSGEYSELSAWLDDVVLVDGGEIQLGTTTKIQFRDADIYISSKDDGHLDLDANTSVDVNSNLLIQKANDLTDLLLETYDEDNAKYSRFIIRKSANETLGNLTQTADTEILGQIIVQGVDDGNGFGEGFVLTATQDGSVGSYVPTTVKMETYTSSGINRSQFVLDQDGSVMLGDAIYSCGSFKMIKGAQTGDPQVEFSLSEDTNGDFTIATDTGDIILSPAGAVQLAIDKKIEFGDNAVHIQSDDDGHLDLTADVSIDLNSDIVVTGDVDISGTLKYDGSDTNPTNLISNGDFESWTAGTNVAPDGYTAGGTGSLASIAREGTIVKQGTYSAKVTSNNTAGHLVIDSFINRMKGKNITLSCWVWCDTAAVAKLNLNDGSVDAHSAYHTGSSTWELLTVTIAVREAATFLNAYFWIYGNTNVAYFDGAMLVEGSTPFAFSPKPLAASAQIVAEADETKFSHKLPIVINGTAYNIMLTTT